jgi:hypothetical protein
MKKAVFWDVAPCRYCVSRRFGGTYRLHLQGRRKKYIRERGTSVRRNCWAATEPAVSSPRSHFSLRFNDTFHSVPWSREYFLKVLHLKFGMLGVGVTDYISCHLQHCNAENSFHLEKM